MKEKVNKRQCTSKFNKISNTFSRKTLEGRAWKDQYSLHICLHFPVNVWSRKTHELNERPFLAADVNKLSLLVLVDFTSARQAAHIPCLHKRRLRWEISVSEGGWGVLRGPLLPKGVSVTGLDGQVGRGRVLGFSCSALAQIRDTCLQTIAYKNERGKNKHPGVDRRGTYLCVHM